ncbi:formimidoylglutamase [Robiginitalea sp. M366]|uniref:formimidoylglutamase n=1 Tax=Robiginitalea aestuariiviva TaxID=3036903 RepID=UPI00240D613D|nr:formimidoylglutamase [Robiginitalea aestuariiviva]MDG1571903.1 formimidoylglutamase [Robiginitalea aestuariiviva]
MAFDFLKPVSQKLLAHCELMPAQALGSLVYKHTEQDGLPVLAGATFALVGIHESRNAFIKKTQRLDLEEIRLQLYRLMLGNWNYTILDLGDIEEGETVKDTYFVVREIMAGLLEENIVPIVIGATQDLSYPMYRAFDGIRDMVNLVSVDSRFDFGADEELISSHSYMSKIITDKPNNLFNFSNIGYQSYFNAQEEVDLMERLFFDAYRLGDITANITLAEPVLRQAHLVSVDTRAIRACEMGMGADFSPNGFTGREICAITRYAGMGEHISALGIFEMDNNPQAFQLVAQMIWYFIEGYNFRVDEKPSESDPDFTHYIVPCDTEELHFYKSALTSRWWVEVPNLLAGHTKSNAVALLPCTEQDYLDACDQIIPERWFKAYKKGFN